MKDYKDPHKEISLDDGFGRPTKKFSVDINYLSEHYKHKYKTYWYIIDIDQTFIKTVKNKEEGKKYIKRCGCEKIWKVKKNYENEQTLRNRTETNRYASQGSHKFLDTHKRHKEAELKFSRDREKEHRKILKNREYTHERRKLETKYKEGIDVAKHYSNHSLIQTSHLHVKIMTDIKIDEEKQKLLKSLMG